MEVFADCETPGVHQERSGREGREQGHRRWSTSACSSVTGTPGRTAGAPTCSSCPPGWRRGAGRDGRHGRRLLPRSPSVDPRSTPSRPTAGSSSSAPGMPGDAEAWSTNFDLYHAVIRRSAKPVQPDRGQNEAWDTAGLLPRRQDAGLSRDARRRDTRPTASAWLLTVAHRGNEQPQCSTEKWDRSPAALAGPPTARRSTPTRRTSGSARCSPSMSRGWQGRTLVEQGTVTLDGGAGGANRVLHGPPAVAGGAVQRRERTGRPVSGDPHQRRKGSPRPRWASRNNSPSRAGTARRSTPTWSSPADFDGHASTRSPF